MLEILVYLEEGFIIDTTNNTKCYNRPKKFMHINIEWNNSLQKYFVEQVKKNGKLIPSSSLFNDYVLNNILPKLNQPLNVCFSKGCGKDIALDTDE
jgi:hypothetical protein